MILPLQTGIQSEPEPWTSLVMFIGVFVVVYLLGRFTLLRVTNSFAAKYAPWTGDMSNLASRVFLILLALSAGLTGAGWYSARFLLILHGVLLVGILLGGVVWFESLLGRNNTNTQ
jgi:hypothetical protein